MSTDWKFNLLDLDILKEIANIGAGNAATSLANMLNTRIDMNVPEVNMPEFKHLPDILNGPENLVAGILVSLSGDINGIMMYVMEQSSACSLTNHILNKNNKSFADFDEMDYSVLTEMGNILTSSYLSSMSELMHFKIVPSIPYLAVDMAGAVLSVPAIEFGKIGDKVLLIKSTVNDNTYMSGYFILIPDFGKVSDNTYNIIDNITGASEK